MPSNDPQGDDLASDLIWGAGNIGRTINKTERQTFYLLERELIPAKKVGEQWVASRQQLRAYFRREAA
jgi:hypothetical protein